MSEPEYTWDDRYYWLHFDKEVEMINNKKKIKSVS